MYTMLEETRDKNGSAHIKFTGKLFASSENKRYENIRQKSSASPQDGAVQLANGTIHNGIDEISTDRQNDNVSQCMCARVCVFAHVCVCVCPCV